MLKKRVLSGLVGVALALLIIFEGGIVYFLTVFIITLLGLEEYRRLSIRGNYYFPRYLSFAAAGVYLLLLYFEVPNVLEAAPLFLFLPFCLYIFFNKDYSFRDLMFSAWGVIYIVWLFSFLIVLRNLPNGLNHTLLLFFSIWISDTAAFFIGSNLGRRKLIPRISPNKSVEGALGGLLGTMLFVYLLRGYVNMEPITAILAGGLISLLGQVGDLMESALKRYLKTKDSGALIPGHGGVLDRFDSVIFAAPFFYFYLIFLSNHI
ncbi:phosphatidate cytidylyltransferase [Candidatus Contubernalis alkaliaceticus]|uniref:phosphatidate cytidylyltransferase n=1 Tax=Candidatus Contubernalis alkaliaceticus TaxID=338645 RepID=UPI001F4BF77F|nr:phosphatidate cytidylyltransferase [Candidatus Contubernalis alkalaceticus]UNC91830.1 phosphatidate cytidylyltransferase [Candidatus Contubernalis alkalaceticus]